MNRFLADILDQPTALHDALAHTVGAGHAALRHAAEMVRDARRVVLTSMGSALYSLMPLHYELARIHGAAHLVPTSDLLLDPPAADATVYLIMSRSGESGEVAEFSGWLRGRGLPLIAVTMTPDSTLARNADLVLHDPVPYDGLICTKAFSSMALVGLLLAAQVECGISKELRSRLDAAFLWMEEHKEAHRARAASIPWLDGSLYFLSWGVGTGLAASGALWLEEAARVASPTQNIGGFLHGPVEQVDEGFRGVWIDLAPNERSRGMFARARARGGRWLTVSVDEPDSSFSLPSLGLSPAYRVLPAATPLQLIAYQSAANRGIEAGDMRYTGWVVK